MQELKMYLIPVTAWETILMLLAAGIIMPLQAETILPG